MGERTALNLKNIGLSEENVEYLESRLRKTILIPRASRISEMLSGIEPYINEAKNSEALLDQIVSLSFTSIDVHRVQSTIIKLSGQRRRDKINDAFMKMFEEWEEEQKLVINAEYAKKKDELNAKEEIEKTLHATKRVVVNNSTIFYGKEIVGTLQSSALNKAFEAIDHVYKVLEMRNKKGLTMHTFTRDSESMLMAIDIAIKELDRRDGNKGEATTHSNNLKDIKRD